mmetsp:Transcript_15344/g.34994  ORF Transcript_15344/g.34994 Transcript_15344/m.34994 type:complete len:248 (-) Transcript_15344:76-819(-)
MALGWVVHLQSAANLFGAWRLSRMRFPRASWLCRSRSPSLCCHHPRFEPKHTWHPSRDASWVVDVCIERQSSHHCRSSGQPHATVRKQILQIRIHLDLAQQVATRPPCPCFGRMSAMRPHESWGCMPISTRCATAKPLADAVPACLPTVWSRSYCQQQVAFSLHSKDRCRSARVSIRPYASHLLQHRRRHLLGQGNLSTKSRLRRPQTSQRAALKASVARPLLSPRPTVHATVADGHARSLLPRSLC